MCGLVAIVNVAGASLGRSSLVKARIDAALRRIRHRGPDGAGSWVSDDGSIAMGHVRLSINDLTDAGSQPMSSTDKTVHCVVNGELYDYQQLRQGLEGSYRFQSNSDSELVLALYARHGLDFVHHLRGEFAICLYDSVNRRMLAVRDRYGIKPLFWRQEGEEIWFAAEQKAWLGLDWKPQWNVISIASGAWYAGSSTIFRGCHRIFPGHMMVVDHSGVSSKRYWTPEYPDKKIIDKRSVDEMIEGTRQRLYHAVEARLQSDVPVGIYLSGGIDSTAIAAVAADVIRNRQLSGRTQSDIACFTIRFEDSGYNESDVAKRSADAMHLPLHEAIVNESNLADKLVEATYHCEHPSMDLGHVAKFILSDLPRKHGYKAVLTGEGADEHFAGYPHNWIDFFGEPDINGSIPDDVRDNIHRALLQLGTYGFASPPLIRGDFPVDLDRRRDEFGEMFMINLLPSVHSAFALPDPALLSHRTKVDTANILAEHLESTLKHDMRHKWHRLHASLTFANTVLLAGYLMSAFGDRVEMGHSLEGRPVFLDHHFTEYINMLPPSVKVKWDPKEEDSAYMATNSVAAIVKAGAKIPGTITEKWILREAVKDLVPEEIYARSKQIYSAPDTFTPDGPMQRLLEQYVVREKVEALGFVNWPTVEKYWAAARKHAFASEPSLAAERRDNSFASKMILQVAEWVMLGESFGVEKWNPDEWMTE